MGKPQKLQELQRLAYEEWQQHKDAIAAVEDYLSAFSDALGKQRELGVALVGLFLKGYKSGRSGSIELEFVVVEDPQDLRSKVISYLNDELSGPARKYILDSLTQDARVVLEAVEEVIHARE